MSKRSGFMIYDEDAWNDPNSQGHRMAPTVQEAYEEGVRDGLRHAARVLRELVKIELKGRTRIGGMVYVDYVTVEALRGAATSFVAKAKNWKSRLEERGRRAGR